MDKRIVIVLAAMILFVPSARATFTNPAVCADGDSITASQSVVQESGLLGIIQGGGNLFSGIFVGSNKNECNLGMTRCDPNGQYQLKCGDYDLDPCLEFPPAGHPATKENFCAFGCSPGGLTASICLQSDVCKGGDSCTPGATRCTYGTSGDQSNTALQGVVTCRFNDRLGCYTWDEQNTQSCNRLDSSARCDPTVPNKAVCVSGKSTTSSTCGSPGDNVCLSPTQKTRCLDDNRDGTFEASRDPKNVVSCQNGCRDGACLDSTGQIPNTGFCGGNSVTGDRRCSPTNSNVIEVCRENTLSTSQQPGKDPFLVTTSGTGKYAWVPLPQSCTFGCNPNTFECNSGPSEQKLLYEDYCSQASCVEGQKEVHGNDIFTCAYDATKGCWSFYAPGANNIERCANGVSGDSNAPTCVVSTSQGTQSILFTIEDIGTNGVPNITSPGIGRIGGIAASSDSVYVSVQIKNSTIPNRNQIFVYRRYGSNKESWRYVTNYSSTVYPNGNPATAVRSSAFYEDLDYDPVTGFLFGLTDSTDGQAGYIQAIDPRDGSNPYFGDEPNFGVGLTSAPDKGLGIAVNGSRASSAILGSDILKYATMDFFTLMNDSGLNFSSFQYQEAPLIAQNVSARHIGCLTYSPVTPTLCVGNRQSDIDYSRSSDRILIMTNIKNSTFTYPNNFIEIYGRDGTFYGIKRNVSLNKESFTLSGDESSILYVERVDTLNSEVNGSAKILVSEEFEQSSCQNAKPAGATECVDLFHLGVYSSVGINGCIDIDDKNLTDCLSTTGGACQVVNGTARCTSAFPFETCNLGETKCSPDGLTKLSCVIDNKTSLPLFQQPTQGESCSPGACVNGQCIKGSECILGSTQCYNDVLSGLTFTRPCVAQPDGTNRYTLNQSDWTLCRFGCNRTSQNTFNATTNITNFTCAIPNSKEISMQKEYNEILLWLNILAGGTKDPREADPIALATTSFLIMVIGFGAGALLSRSLTGGLLGAIGLGVIATAMGWMPSVVLILMFLGVGFLIFQKLQGGGG